MSVVSPDFPRANRCVHEGRLANSGLPPYYARDYLKAAVGDLIKLVPK
jgi:hypothetical protein